MLCCVPGRLCELNVLRQVFHVATSPVVASAWSEGQELHVYGLIYDVADGHLRKLAGPIRWVGRECVCVCACVAGVCGWCVARGGVTCATAWT